MLEGAAGREEKVFGMLFEEKLVSDEREKDPPAEGEMFRGERG